MDINSPRIAPEKQRELEQKFRERHHHHGGALRRVGFQREWMLWTRWLWVLALCVATALLIVHNSATTYARSHPNTAGSSEHSAFDSRPSYHDDGLGLAAFLTPERRAVVVPGNGGRSPLPRFDDVGVLFPRPQPQHHRSSLSAPVAAAAAAAAAAGGGADELGLNGFNTHHSHHDAEPASQVAEQDTTPETDARPLLFRGEEQPKEMGAPLQQQQQQQQQQQRKQEVGSTTTSDEAAPAPTPVLTSNVVPIDFTSVLKKYGPGINPKPQVRNRFKKTFVDFRTSECMYTCKLLKAMQWETGINDFPAVFPALLLTHWTNYKKYRSASNSIVNQIGPRGSECIGGGKGKQLRCRESLAATHGCEYSSLALQPQQWNFQNPAQCKDFFRSVDENAREGDTWIVKPGGSYHGDGIQLHHGVGKLKKRYGACKRVFREGVIAQEYISKPVLWEGKKFDFRSYLLIASTEPFLAFYHDGFVRRAELKYSSSSSDPRAAITNSRSQSEDNHFYGFSHLQEMLTRDHGFASDFMQTKFLPHALRASLYLFHTAKNLIFRRKGRFQVYALDWMLDVNGDIHLLEANGNPLVRDYPGTGLTPAMWTSMIELEEKIHMRPKQLPDLAVRQGFAYSGWKLIYNELEEAMEQDAYDACRVNAYADEQHPLYGFATTTATAGASAGVDAAAAADDDDDENQGE
jgi:hypothetical protein